jgi:type VI secretion system (T6SS) immunity protein Tsi2
MPEVTGRTIAVAIRAVQEEMRHLKEEIENGDEEGQADAQELLLSTSLAAQELKKAYEHALRMSDNLLPYESLVSNKF